MKRDPLALTREHFDIVVIGGGIVGACVARDAALRGFSTALIEKNDFCSATSAATSKMIHGGVRYLSQLQLAVVRESLRERRIWQRVAPHLVHPLPFVFPFFGTRQRLEGTLALTLFDLLAFDRGRLDDPDQRLPGHEWWSRSQTLERIPLLRSAGLNGAVCYSDCQAVSPERICIECLTDAALSGARIANYIRGERLVRDGGRVSGITARDMLTGDELTIRARCVVNATGPWLSDLLREERSDSPVGRMMRSKGIHVIVRQLAARYALLLRERAKHAFVIPWRGHSLIGTTDTPFHGDLDHVGIDGGDVDHLLGIVNRGMPDARLTPSDVEFAYAGIRSLVGAGGKSYRASRRAEIVDHQQSGGPAGLISALGGKWTTARHVAQQCVDIAARQLGAADRPCNTADRPLPGGNVGRLRQFREEAARNRPPGVPAILEQHLIGLYGARYRDVLALTQGRPDLAAPLSDAVPDIGAQVAFAAREEQALHVTDVILRRSGLGTLGAPGPVVLDRVIDVMAAERKWSPADIARERADVASYYEHARATA